MGGSLSATDSTVVSAFRSSLAHQGVFLLLVLVALALVWAATAVPRLLGPPGEPPAPAPAGAGAVDAGEPPARMLLRIGFALLWILDGLLQLQPAMPLGMPSAVFAPAAGSSPGWVQRLVDVAVNTWTNHPVQAATATVWIQLGVGLLLLVAPRGTLSRLAGAGGAAWGLVVWVFGEALGGLAGGGASWLYGAPGAALLYFAAGILLALPEQAWDGRRLGRGVLAGIGALFAGMAVLQAWPGRGFWQGPGALSSMVGEMAGVPQPGWLAGWVRSFASLAASDGGAVNLAVVAALASAGVLLASGRRRLVRAGVLAAGALCLADWVLVQDLGFFGGTGTDPNSMIPTLFLLAAGYVAFARPRPAGAPVPESVVAAVRRHRPAFVAGALASLAAVVAALVGAVPMAAAAANPNADPIIAVAADGTPQVADTPAPAFRLTDQHGREVSLASLRGRTVALTFLDPVCTSDCPVIAQEMRKADSLLGAAAGKVELVAVVANPVDHALAYVDAFDHQELLDRLPNWLYLTGSDAALREVWQSYGVPVQVSPAGAMVAHDDIVYLIDGAGDTREILDARPGAGPAARSSFAVYLSQQLETVLRQ